MYATIAKIKKQRGKNGSLSGILLPDHTGRGAFLLRHRYAGLKDSANQDVASGVAAKTNFKFKRTEIEEWRQTSGETALNSGNCGAKLKDFILQYTFTLDSYCVSRKCV